MAFIKFLTLTPLESIPSYSEIVLRIFAVNNSDKEELAPSNIY